jgi:short-subunit dehydrogenase
MKNIIITGGSKGIGLGLAREFLQRGCRVVISARGAAVLRQAAGTLTHEFGLDRTTAIDCDVTDIDQVQALWDGALEALGTVDIWINNAGIANTTRLLHQLDSTEIPRVVSTNLIGVMLGTQVALKGMLAQGSGQIYNMEGFGSDDMLRPGLAVYGASKRAVRYFSESIAEEVKDTPVQVGTLGPGIVVTDFLIDDMRKMDPDQLEHTKVIYNILADTVETVTPFLAEEVLKNTANGQRIHWMPMEKGMARSEDPAYQNRDLFSAYGL